MIKLLAMLFMLVDHVGMILFPQHAFLRIVGRLSMPLFAYGVASGYFYSEKKNTSMKYIKNMFLFALVSQIPYTWLSYMVLGSFTLNIGFTWLLSLVLLKTINSEQKSIRLFFMCSLIFFIGLIIPLDYGIYGILYPVIFYLFLVSNDKPLYAFAGTAFLFLFYMMFGGSNVQIFSLAAILFLLYYRNKAHKNILNRKFYYLFYPAHITVLLFVSFVRTVT